MTVVTAVLVTTLQLTVASANAGSSSAPCTVAARPTNSITVWHALDGPRAKLLAQIADEFEATSGIHVTLVDAQGGDTLLQDWRHNSRRTRPDLALVPQDGVQLLGDSGTILGIDKCLDRATGPDLLPVVRSTYTVQGRVWALPLAVSTPVLLYNRRVFRDAGLDPDAPPTSPADIRAASARIVASGAARYGLAFDTGAESGGSWFVEQWLSQLDRESLSPGNGHQGAARSVTWPDDESVSALLWLAQLEHDGLAVDVGPNRAGSDDLLRLGAQHDSAAMVLHTSAALGETLDLVDDGRQPGVELGVAQLPGPGRGGLVGGSGLVFAAGKPARAVAASWAFAAYFASPEVQSRWSAGSGYLPPSAASTNMEPLTTTWTARPQMAVAFTQLADLPATDARSGPIAGPMRSIRQQLAAATSRAVDGINVRRALLDAARAANSLLRDYDTATAARR
ncbi:MAG TPA: extracellular solute-binding protein [Acidimicrobiia bacterium]